MIKNAKNNQGEQAFLGILACFLGSQYDVHLDAKFNFDIRWKLLLRASFRSTIDYLHQRDFLCLDLFLKCDKTCEILDLSKNTSMN